MFERDEDDEVRERPKPKYDSHGFANYCPKCGSADFSEGTWHEKCNRCGYEVSY